MVHIATSVIKEEADTYSDSDLAGGYVFYGYFLQRIF